MHKKAAWHTSNGWTTLPIPTPPAPSMRGYPNTLHAPQIEGEGRPCLMLFPRKPIDIHCWQVFWLVCSVAPSHRSWPPTVTCLPQSANCALCIVHYALPQTYSSGTVRDLHPIPCAKRPQRYTKTADYAISHRKYIVYASFCLILHPAETLPRPCRDYLHVSCSSFQKHESLILCRDDRYLQIIHTFCISAKNIVLLQRKPAHKG